MINMKVSNVFQVYDTYKAQKPSATNRVSRAEEKRDLVAISSQAKDFQAVKKALLDTPDIREEKVAAVRSRLTAGQQPSTSDVASKMAGLLAFM